MHTLRNCNQPAVYNTSCTWKSVILLQLQHTDTVIKNGDTVMELIQAERGKLFCNFDSKLRWSYFIQYVPMVRSRSTKEVLEVSSKRIEGEGSRQTGYSVLQSQTHLLSCLKTQYGRIPAVHVGLWLILLDPEVGQLQPWIEQLLKRKWSFNKSWLHPLLGNISKYSYISNVHVKITNNLLQKENKQKRLQHE